jgi:hypothetical protein
MVREEGVGDEDGTGRHGAVEWARRPPLGVLVFERSHLCVGHVCARMMQVDLSATAWRHAADVFGCADEHFFYAQRAEGPVAVDAGPDCAGCLRRGGPGWDVFAADDAAGRRGSFHV